MTDLASDSPVPNDPPAPADGWSDLLANLRRRYPGQKDSVLFCVHKLSQDAELTLRDFRDEARLHGIPMAGRALHSARVLLGLAPATKPAAPPAPASDERAATAPVQRVRRERRAANDGDAPGAIETQVLDAVNRIRTAADADAEKLRQAMRDAIAILQRALDE